MSLVTRMDQVSLKKETKAALARKKELFHMLPAGALDGYLSKLRKLYDADFAEYKRIGGATDKNIIYEVLAEKKAKGEL